MIDPLRISQVFDNLLSNALKYSSKGTTVTVTVAQTDPAHLRLTVADQGQGIPASDCRGCSRWAARPIRGRLPARRAPV